MIVIKDPKIFSFNFDFSQLIYLLHVQKKKRKQYKNNWLKIIVPAWNDKFELPNGSYSVSDIQDHIEYIIKRHHRLTTIPSIQVYINRINNRLMLKIEDGYKLELLATKIMKLFC